MDIERAKQFYEFRLTTIEAWPKVAQENGIKLTEFQVGQAAGIRTTIIEIIGMLYDED